MPRHASSYDVAVTCDELAAQRKRGKAIAAEVGRSQSWVSRHLAALRNASAELVEVWRAGRLPDEVILRIATLPRAAQAAAISDPTTRPPAASRHRPTIMDVKRRRASIAETDDYWRGVGAALDWVLGRGDAQAAALAVTGNDRHRHHFEFVDGVPRPCSCGLEIQTGPTPTERTTEP